MVDDRASCLLLIRIALFNSARSRRYTTRRLSISSNIFTSYSRKPVVIPFCARDLGVTWSYQRNRPIVKATPDKYTTGVYVKPTNTGQTLNAKSECPSKYKQSVLRAFITRAIKTSSTHELMDTELNRVRQLLVNNGYCNSEIDQEINQQLHKQQQPVQTETQKKTTHILYYKNYVNTQYKTDEKNPESICIVF